MARKKTADEPVSDARIADYRYDDSKRKNIPPAGLAAQGKVAESNRIEYAYNPHLPPVLRFDDTGQSDYVGAKQGSSASPAFGGNSDKGEADTALASPLLETVTKRALSEDEARLLVKYLQKQSEPWLEWSGKREKKGFAVDPVALHIHERISAQAITKVAARQDVQRDLFADPQLDYQKAVQFYQHDVDWANRMILGDSLQVMASLARREDVAGKVQMIYMDPPYGIKFASNFQPEIGKRDVKDKEADLTREPEMVRAYRDTWTLGVHSYLAYLRDRLILSRELLADSGSVFVQISDENLHRVRMLMDDVFGAENFVVTICFKKKAYQDASELAAVNDYLLWYAKCREKVKFNPLYIENVFDGEVGKYNKITSPSGIQESSLSFEEKELKNKVAEGWRLVRDDYPIVSQDPPSTPQPYTFCGITYEPTPGRHWSQQYPEGMNRLASGNSRRHFVLSNQERCCSTPRMTIWSL